MPTRIIPQRPNDADIDQLESDVATLQTQVAGKEPLTSRVNALFVGKHGSNANNGLTPANAKLTFQAAINAASSGDTINCFDNGTYTESLTCKSGVDIFAPNAIIANVGTTTHTLANDVNINFGGSVVGPSNTGFTLNGESVTARLHIRDWILNGDAVGILSLDGNLEVWAFNILMGTGFFIGGMTTDEIQLTFQEISIVGAGTAFGISTPGAINVFGSSIKDDGSGTIFYSTDIEATISAIVTKISVENLSNIGSACTTRMVSPIRSGNLYEIGAGRVVNETDLLVDTTPQLGGNLDLNTKNISSLGALAADHSYEGTIINRAVGETVAFGQGLYFDWADKEYKIANATAAGTMPIVGIALEAKNNGEVCKILVKGWIRDDTYNFAGSIVYGGEAGGDFVTTAPSDSGDQVQVCGTAYSADIMYFDPSPVLVEIA